MTPLKQGAALEGAFCEWLGATNANARLAAAVTLLERCNAYVEALSANLERPAVAPVVRKDRTSAPAHAGMNRGRA